MYAIAWTFHTDAGKHSSAGLRKRVRPQVQLSQDDTPTPRKGKRAGSPLARIVGSACPAPAVKTSSNKLQPTARTLTIESCGAIGGSSQHIPPLTTFLRRNPVGLSGLASLAGRAIPSLFRRKAMKPRNVALIVGTLLTLVIALASVIAWSYLFRSSLDPDDDLVFFDDADPYQVAPWTRPQNFEGPLSPVDMQTVRGEVAKAADCTLSGPYTHANLTVFLIHGLETLPSMTYLTLQEAIESGLAVVHETDNVSQLAVENLSSSDEVYIQSGDILKGGKQDRVIQEDLVLAPHSGRVPLASFCVEQGRWVRRGRESAAMFQDASVQLAGKDIKLANRYRKSQGGVWKDVKSTQGRLSKKLGGSVQSGESQSSFRLTLDHDRVQQAIASYLSELSPVIADKERVIGCAFAINGKVNCAEVYASGVLFKKLWPKMLQAAAVEAVAELEQNDSPQPIEVETIKTFLSEAEQGKAYKQPAAERIHVILHETNKYLLFDTCDRLQGNNVLHRSYLAR
jgi:hypothetical protein